MTAQRPRDRERVDCRCWCQAQTLRVTSAEVRRGLTRSCGREACDDLDTAGYAAVLTTELTGG